MLNGLYEFTVVRFAGCPGVDAFAMGFAFFVIAPILAAVLECFKPLPMLLVLHPATLVHSATIIQKNPKAFTFTRLRIDLAFISCIFVPLDGEVLEVFQLGVVEDVGHHVVVRGDRHRVVRHLRLSSCEGLLWSLVLGLRVPCLLQRFLTADDWVH